MSVYRKSLQVLSLILFLFAGQLQAKTVYSCTMVDKNVHGAMMDTDMDNMQDEENYCHNHKSFLSLDCDDKTSSDTNLCYKKIVVLNDMQLNIPIPDLLTESDVDPPQEKFTTLDLVSSSRVVTVSHRFPRIDHIQFGSKIHLITQRLRI